MNKWGESQERAYFPDIAITGWSQSSDESGGGFGAFLYPHTQLDAQVSYTFKNGLEILSNALNLNNAVFGFYFGSPHWNNQREFYNRTFSVGFRVSR